MNRMEQFVLVKDIAFLAIAIPVLPQSYQTSNSHSLLSSGFDTLIRGIRFILLLEIFCGNQ